MTFDTLAYQFFRLERAKFGKHPDDFAFDPFEHFARVSMGASDRFFYDTVDEFVLQHIVGGEFASTRLVDQSPDLAGEELPVARRDPGERGAAEIHDDLGERRALPIETANGGGEVGGEEGEKEFEVVDLLAQSGWGEQRWDAHAGTSCISAVENCLTLHLGRERMSVKRPMSGGGTGSSLTLEAAAPTVGAW